MWEHFQGFDEIVLADFEFSAPPGEIPKPVCLIAHEIRSGRVHRLWRDKFVSCKEPPYPVGSKTLFVSYFASAEFSCHLALDWQLPAKTVDLYTEFRLLTNGIGTPCGDSLLGALAYFGLEGIESVEKDSMRQLAQRDTDWSADEKAQLLDYCESDVLALKHLLDAMAPKIDIGRALLRGRYMVAVARMEYNGVPIDTTTLDKLRQHWGAIKLGLIADVDAGRGIYEGSTFKRDRFGDWLTSQGIAWPTLESGQLALDDETFREMSRLHPQLEPYRQLRTSLSQMRLEDLAVGQDGRNRTLLSLFRSRTGRNQPSNTRFIFGPSAWMRSLIQPRPGWGLAYIDWSQQEFGIAAKLSVDQSMIEAYESGDPYLAFAVQAGAAPKDATKKSHKNIRSQFKQCALGVQYGMREESLARKIGKQPAHARELLELHRRTYPVYWRWADAAVDHAMLHGSLYTVFGWTVQVGPEVNPRSLRNFPMQANGAEMLRLGCCLATERGVRVCAPVHDAVLIEAPLKCLDHAVAETQSAMAEASATVLDGFRLRTDVEVFRHPERFRDERGAEMWHLVEQNLEQIDG